MMVPRRAFRCHGRTSMCAVMALLTRCLAVGCVAAATTGAGGQPPDSPPGSGTSSPAVAPSSPAGEVKQAPPQSPPAQDQHSEPAAGPKQRDLLDIAHRVLGISIKPGGDKPKSLSMLILPIIDQNPTNGFVFGIEAT